MSIRKVLRPLFWEYDTNKLGWPKNADLIIGKILMAGNWDQKVWLRREIGDHAIGVWIIKNDAHGLEPEDLRFWQLLSGLPDDLVEQWLQEPARQIWAAR